MKKPLSTTAMLLCSIILLNSCANNSISHTQRKTDFENSKKSAVCFVQYKDGTVKNFKSLKLVTGLFTAPHLLADGKLKIRSKQIAAYQNGEHFAISQDSFSNGRQNAVAIETLPGFAIRTVKGNLNVYCKKYYNGQVAVDEYFIQAGDNGRIIAFTKEQLNEIVKNNSKALAFFNSNKNKGTLSEKLLATAELYNNVQSLSKN